MRHRERGAISLQSSVCLIFLVSFLPVSQGSLCVKAKIDVNISLDCTISGQEAFPRPLLVILKHSQVCFFVWSKLVMGHCFFLSGNCFRNFPAQRVCTYFVVSVRKTEYMNRMRTTLWSLATNTRTDRFTGYSVVSEHMHMRVVTCTS